MKKIATWRLRVLDSAGSHELHQVSLFRVRGDAGSLFRGYDRARGLVLACCRECREWVWVPAGRLRKP